MFNENEEDNYEDEDGRKSFKRDPARISIGSSDLSAQGSAPVSPPPKKSKKLKSLLVGKRQTAESHDTIEERTET